MQCVTKYFTIFLFVVGCSIDNQDSKKNSDSVFISNLDIMEETKVEYILKSFYWTKLIGEKFIVQIPRPVNNEKLPVFIKEFYKDSLYNYYLQLKDAYHYFSIPEYDSSKYDGNLIINLELNDNEKDSLFSSKFYRIYELRKNDKKYQEGLKEMSDIKELEDFINKTNFFKNFSITNKEQYELLKEFIILTQVVLAQPLPEHDEYRYIYNTMNFYDIHEISSQDHYNLYEKSLRKIRSKNKIQKAWTSANKEMLNNLLPEIKADYYKKEILYFYTKPDYKLIKVEIKRHNSKVVLEKKYYNPEYMWLHRYTQFIRNKEIIKKHIYAF